MTQSQSIQKLNDKVGKWVADWVCGETQKELFFEEPPQNLTTYLQQGKRRGRLSSSCEDLLFWHFNQYANEAINNSFYSWEDFALCARYSRAAVEFKSGMIPKETPLLEYAAALCLSLNMIAGWKTSADRVGQMLLHGLDTELLDLLHNERHQSGTLFRHFWFLMHLYCDAKGLELDTSKYSYPEDMSPYAQVLADWRTPDLTKVQGFVSAMADFHVQEARTTAHDEIAEFDTEDRMLFPYEILAFLRMREWLGLANPEVFEHPLMQQPLAKLPKDVPLAVPETPLLDQVIVKFQQEYPGSFA